MPRRVTMKEVAAKAQVSASTVCRALNADPQIPESTRLRVKKIADNLGYLPDPLISAFAQRRRGSSAASDITTLAYITNFETADEWMKNPFYALVFQGAQEQARRNGFKLEHHWLGAPGMTGERLSRILHNRGIVGACIAPMPSVRSRLNLDWPRFSCVTIGHSLIRPELHRTTPHHFHGILTANRKLWRLGYSRIGLCLYDRTSSRVDDLWLAGALLAQRYHPHVTTLPFLFTDDTLRDIPAWIRRARLEVVVSDNQIVLDEMRRQGLESPGQVDYATLNWVRTEPEIAGIDQRPAAIGATTIDTLIAQIRRSERGIPKIPVSSMVECTWVNGPSLRRHLPLTKPQPPPDAPTA